MYIVQGITDDTLQTQSLNLYDGSILSYTIYFVPMQYSWVFTSLTWNSWTLTGLKVCNNPNMLRPWKNILTFGLACFSTNNREPQLATDFSSGKSTLYILSANEVQQYEDYLSGQVIS